MTEYEDRLDSALHKLLKEYPQVPLPQHFQTAVMARITTVPPIQTPIVVAERYQSDPVTIGFLEMSSALVMGLLLSVVLLLGLLVGDPIPAGGLLPITLSLDWQTLPWGWITAAVMVVVVELIMVILAGLHLTES